MKVTPSQQQKPTPNKFSKKWSNKEPPSSKRPLISWFRLHNSVMSPEFLLNSLFHSVPVKGDYKLSKKNEILVDLFLSTLFHTVPPRSPLPPFQPFLPTKFASSFLFFKFCLFLFFFYFSLSAHRFSQSRGQVRGHLARPHRWAWATWQQRSPLLGICCPVPNFHLHPPPLAPTVKKTPAGMLQWRAVSARGPCGSKVWMLSRGESHWELIGEKKVGNKGGWRTSALARGQRRSQEAKRATFCASKFSRRRCLTRSLVRLSRFILRLRLRGKLKRPILLFQKQIFKSTSVWGGGGADKKKKTNDGGLIETICSVIRWKSIGFLVQLMSRKILRVELCR